MNQLSVHPIRKLLQRMGMDLVRHIPADVEPDALGILEQVRPFTMTSVQRIYSVYQAVQYIEHYQIPGAIVECGVWRGGSSMAAALTLLKQQHTSKAPVRDLHLFDTFEGMSEPTEHDVSKAGQPAQGKWEQSIQGNGSSQWCYASEEDVRQNMTTTGYPAERVHLHPGRVEDTLPEQAPEQIALLRLDTDWYESTRHELIHLFPRLAVGGVLIIDDYGEWQGARRAVDEYMVQTGVRLLLNRIDYTGRIAIKQEPAGAYARSLAQSSLPPYEPESGDAPE